MQRNIDQITYVYTVSAVMNARKARGICIVEVPDALGQIFHVVYWHYCVHAIDNRMLALA